MLQRSFPSGSKANGQDLQDLQDLKAAYFKLVNPVNPVDSVLALSDADWTVCAT
jgi:hypothetical protein